MAETYLGIDLGTTQLKVGLFDRKGRLLHMAAHGYPLTSPEPEAAEQDAGRWWEALLKALRDVRRQSDTAAGIASNVQVVGAWERIAAISVAGQGPTVVAVDSAGEPLRPALTWADRRCQPEADELGTNAGYSALARILWIARHDRDTYARTRWFFESYDYLTFRLTNEPVTIVSLPGLAPWNDQQIMQAGLDPDKFPSVQTLLGTVVGAVTEEAARVTGLRSGIPVVTGTVDAFAHWIGLGMNVHGRLCDIGGTSEGVGLSWPERLLDYENGIFPMPNPLGSGWVCGGSMSNGGSALAWFRDQFYAPTFSYETVLEDIAATPAGADGLIALPYLLGERIPVSDPLARACFFGVGREHGRAHFGRALLEGVAFGMRQVVDALEATGGNVDHVVASGGATRAQLWTQVKADVLGRSVHVPAVTESGLLGTAILARAAVTDRSVQDVADEMVVLEQRFDPIPEHKAVYDASYPTYAALYGALREQFHTLADARRSLRLA